MAENINITSELQTAQYDTFASMMGKVRDLSNQYGAIPFEQVVKAFGDPNPYVQNKRVKHISSAARKFTKPQVEEMIGNIANNEQPLREVEKQLEGSAYPLFHIRSVYQNLLTYHSYVAPFLVEEGEMGKPEFWREWKVLEKLRKEFHVKQIAHEITGQCLQEGKVFYYPRYSVDKSHNKVNYAFMQQLPSDWVKIVGFNNKSKYTLAFNLMYFCEEGTDYRQFGTLFEPFMDEFNRTVFPLPTYSEDGKIVYASKSRIDLSRVKGRTDVEAYMQNGRWFYWVMLPVTEVFTFELDEVTRNVVPPFTGLLLDMLQLSSLEALQLELLSNPLVAILTGEIPYFETKDTNVADQYKLSNAGRKFFEALWYQMTARTNTGGIGLYAAPLKDMKLETLPEAPNATNIVSNGYKDVMNKAGLSGIMPVSDDARAGVAQISFMIESQFPKPIYRCFERMMNVIIESLNLKNEFRFYMFGDLATDKDVREESKKEMQLGILPATIIYNAMHDRSIIEDIAWSQAIRNSKVLDNRIPLVTSYTMSPDAGIPPTGDKEPGRPQSDGTTSDGTEAESDAKGETRFME